MNHQVRRTMEHAVETVLLLGALALTAAAVRPGTGVPAWVLPVVEITAGAVACLSVRVHSGRGTLAFFCALFGTWNGAWTIWAETGTLWSAPVITAWIIGMIICCPLAVHAALKGREDPAAAADPAMIQPSRDPSPEEERVREIGLFKNMFDELVPVPAGHAGVDVTDVREERAGRVVRLKLPRSGKITMASLTEVTPRIEVILELRPGSVEFLVGDNSSDVIMKLREREVFSASPRLVPEAYATSISQPFAIGAQEDGTRLNILLRELHAYVVGATGMGKSNLVNVLVSQIARCPDALIWFIDMKGGRTAKPWIQPWIEGMTERPALDWVATTRDEAARMMEAFKAAIDVRMNSGVGASKISPSPAMPQIILICDEMATLFGAQRGRRSEVGDDAKTNQQFISLGEECVQLGRSEAAACIWVTQRGTNSMAGSGDIKSQCKMRIALGAASEGDLQYVIPDARLARKQLSMMATTPGVGLAAVGRHTSQLSKFFLHDHIEGQCSENGNDGCVPACPVRQAAIETGPARPPLDQMTASGLGSDYAERWQRAGSFFRRGAPVPAPAPAGDTAQFEDIVASIPDPEENIHPARRRMREILAARGVQGATPGRIGDQLKADGMGVARETVQRWLAQDSEAGIVHSADYGRWVIGPDPAPRNNAA